jgi:hypothetical protein
MELHPVVSNNSNRQYFKPARDTNISLMTSIDGFLRPPSHTEIYSQKFVPQRISNTLNLSNSCSNRVSGHYGSRPRLTTHVTSRNTP